MLNAQTGEFQPARRHPRFAFRAPIFVHVPEWSKLAARGLDLSRGGIGVILPVKLALGDRLTFGLSNTDGSHLILHAEVCYVRLDTSGGYRTGLRWLDLDPEAETDLHDFVDRIGEQS